MQKLNLLTYSDSLFAPMQEKLVAHASSLGCFDTIYTKHRENLVSTDFYSTHKDILDRPKGGGYCLWKPFFIIQALSRMDENDILLYMDAADWIENGDTLRSTVMELMKDKDLLLTDGAYRNADWTRRDTFVMMGCDSEKYWNAIQLEAGIVVVKNTEFTNKMLLEWLNWCKIAAVVTEDDNVCGLPNLDGFREHRYDQSVLTNLRYKYDLYSSGEMRPFIHCNINMPECRK